MYRFTRSHPAFILFFFIYTATSEIYTLSLHDALPIFVAQLALLLFLTRGRHDDHVQRDRRRCQRSEEHTSELQSLRHLVCRLLLEKKKKTKLRLGNKARQETIRVLDVCPSENLLLLMI